MPAAPLLDREFLEKLERLTIHWQKSFAGLVGGHNVSRFAGSGQEFLDHRHFHHGDQYTTVQEGEIHIDIDGKGDQVFKAGDVVHIDPTVVHRTQNLSGKPARTTELFIVAKGKPLSERADLAAQAPSH